MVCDTKIKLGIINYAKPHGIYEEKLFAPLFELCTTVTFRRGEQVKFIKEDVLCLIYSGAVLGRLEMGDGHVEQHLLRNDQIFYTGNKLEGMRERVESSWQAILPCEVIYIPLAVIQRMARSEPGYWQGLMRHIIASDMAQSQLYHEVHRQPTLVDKLDVLLRHDERLLDIKQVYLASYLLVTAPSFSRVLKEWDRRNLP
ncbi:hypothetical protein LZF95_00075 [Algoriphagus sp. AGSA1]|uniref:hypothetical protein n=1 Tax=Algoriphagus sp. AGSA1 TaxID=2907213 RepID=UPI001F48751C|nr:hypothetical protein [Algoriphagus sp. AGSA1]MCE7053050.1 hypothetical protein [Algoriphagus sp. AGSA1]